MEVPPLKKCVVVLVDEHNGAMTVALWSRVPHSLYHDGCLSPPYLPRTGFYIGGPPAKQVADFTAEIKHALRFGSVIFALGSYELFLAVRAMVKRGEVNPSEIQVLWPRPDRSVTEIHLDADGRYEAPPDFTFGAHFDRLLAELL